MNRDEFDHDADANEYHIAVKQHLYKEIAALHAHVRGLEASLENAREDWRVAYARLEKEDARVAELEAVREAADTVVHDWDWWEVDPADREGPGDAIRDLRAALAAIAEEVTHGDDG